MKFDFAVPSNKRPQKTTVPELSLTPTKNKLKLNESASLLLGVYHGDNALIINNYDNVVKAAAEEGLTGEALTKFLDENVAFAVTKGVNIERDGAVVVGRKVLSKEDKEALDAGKYEGPVDKDGHPTEVKQHGCKLANSQKSASAGVILGFSDAVNYPLMGGRSGEGTVIYTVEGKAITINLPINGEPQEIDVYPLTKSRFEALNGSEDDDEEGAEEGVNGVELTTEDAEY